MLSIIIPTLNEEENIGVLLRHLWSQKSGVEMQIIVIDGGSTDSTRSEVEAFIAELGDGGKGIRFRESGKTGRASQMNVGASLAIADYGNTKDHILYFLHADSLPPKHYDLHILNAVKKGHPAGCFRMKFDSRHPWLKLMGWFTRFSWRAARGGDQSQYITSELFQELGGYDESYPVYEDYRLIRQLYDRKTFYVIPKWLVTSARRYQDKGVARLQWFYLNIYWRKFCGADANELYAYYRRWCS